MLASGFRSLCLVVLIGLTLSGCGRGWRDSLLLTGIRDKPDETKIQTNDVLVLPEDDRVVAPDSITVGAAKRSDAFKVNTILFGEEIAEEESERQLAIASQNAYSPTEALLLKHVYTAVPDRSSQPAEEKRKWWQIRVPRVFGRD